MQNCGEVWFYLGRGHKTDHHLPLYSLVAHFFAENFRIVFALSFTNKKLLTYTLYLLFQISIILLVVVLNSCCSVLVKKVKDYE